MPPLWDHMHHHLEEPLSITLYAAGWLLLGLLLGDICLQAVPRRLFRINRALRKTPVKTVATATGRITFAPTRRVHHAPWLFGIGFHLLIVGLLASLGVAFAYRMTGRPVLEAFWFVPLLPLHEPAAGMAFLLGALLTWSGFRFRMLRSVSLAGFVLIDLCWVFLVAWISLGKPLDRLQPGSYPNPGWVPWMVEAWANAWRQKPHPSGFLFLGAGLFFIGILTVYLGSWRPKEKRGRAISIAYIQGPGQKSASEAEVR